MHVPGMICGCMSLEGDGEREKVSKFIIMFRYFSKSKMSWTIAWHLTLLNACQLCCNFGTCQRLSLGTSLSSGVEFAIPVLIVLILRKLWFWNAFTWPTTSIQIKWWNFITSWHIGHGYVVYFTPWFFLPSFWVHHVTVRTPQFDRCQAHIVWLNREAGWRISEDRCRKFCAACFRNCCTVHPQFCFRSMPEKCREIHRTFFFDRIVHWMLGFLDGWYARAEGHRKNWQSAVVAFVPIFSMLHILGTDISQCQMMPNVLQCQPRHVLGIIWWCAPYFHAYERKTWDMLHHVAPHFILIFIQASVSRIHRQIPLNAPLDFDRAGLPSLWEILGRQTKSPESWIMTSLDCAMPRSPQLCWASTPLMLEKFSGQFAKRNIFWRCFGGEVVRRHWQSSLKKSGQFFSPPNITRVFSRRLEESAKEVRGLMLEDHCSEQSSFIHFNVPSKKYPEIWYGIFCSDFMSDMVLSNRAFWFFQMPAPRGFMPSTLIQRWSD